MYSRILFKKNGNKGPMVWKNQDLRYLKFNSYEIIQEKGLTSLKTSKLHTLERGVKQYI